MSVNVNIHANIIICSYRKPRIELPTVKPLAPPELARRQLPAQHTYRDTLGDRVARVATLGLFQLCVVELLRAKDARNGLAVIGPEEHNRVHLTRRAHLVTAVILLPLCYLPAHKAVAAAFAL
jgi:hypothetical protein